MQTIKTAGMFTKAMNLGSRLTKKPKLGTTPSAKRLGSTSLKSGADLQLGGGVTSLPSLKKPSVSKIKPIQAGFTGYKV